MSLERSEIDELNATRMRLIKTCTKLMLDAREMNVENTEPDDRKEFYTNTMDIILGINENFNLFVNKLYKMVDTNQYELIPYQHITYQLSTVFARLPECTVISQLRDKVRRQFEFINEKLTEYEIICYNCGKHFTSSMSSDNLCQECKNYLQRERK